MSDNTGNYIEYEELIGEMLEDSSPLVSSEETTLSAKVVDAGGDVYTFTSGSPQLNDVVYQGGELAVVIGFPSGTQIQIDRTDVENTIVNGPAKFVRSAQLTKRRAESMIKSKMQFVDRATRQFFNKRTGTFEIEGSNTPVMYFPVPIIEITSLVINSTDSILTEGDDFDFVAFKGRELPTDDRKNPRIKLNVGRGRDSIFIGSISNRVFARNTLTTVVGSFGYLEADGSTPEGIKDAMKLLIFDTLNNPYSSSGGSGESATGPLRRIKVDLHEKEFFAPTTSSSSDSRSSLSGIHEVDVLLAQYKSPLVIGGSFPHFRGQSLNEY